MCGITGCVGRENVASTLLTTLENLEYRGYDSSGIAVRNGTGVSIDKHEGEVAVLERRLTADGPDASVGIGHTRWSTHGPPSDANAHPHGGCSERLAVVHNGIIENHGALRDELEARGHEFTSETDTEVVPHLVEERLRAGSSPEAAFRDVLGELEGTYALAMVVAGEPSVYAAREGSPLVLGIGDRANYLASDVPAFVEFTNDVVHLEDGDVAVLTAGDYRVTDRAGRPVDRGVETVEWDAEDAEKSGYNHYMLKEIHEQPQAVRRTLDGRIDDDAVTLDSVPQGAFEGCSRVQFVGCGTSYHAGHYAEQLFTDCGIPASAFLASEYVSHPPTIDRETLVIGVTQSGETADTLEALGVARTRGADTLAVTNTVGSTAARTCDETLLLRAGPEIGVAATKTFSSQVVALLLLREHLARELTGSPTDGAGALLEELASIPDRIETMLERTRAPAVSDRCVDSDGRFFVGRGKGFSVALEGALKFKEITYEHAEGFAAGELKHGPLALVTSTTPVFAVSTGRHAEKIRSNVREIQARDAPVVAVLPQSSTDLANVADEVLTVPATRPELVAVLANVQLQLVAYHAAARMNRPIDKPRNLAKSVTVE